MASSATTMEAVPCTNSKERLLRATRKGPKLDFSNIDMDLLHQRQIEENMKKQEQRMRAQEIVKNLWLGPAVVMDDFCLPHGQEFTAVLNITKDVPNLKNYGKHTLDASTVVHDRISIDDDPHLVNIKKEFQEAANFIEQQLNQGGTVLVHCKMGISRSAAMVAAYLILKENMTFDDALNTIRQHRECIDLNMNFHCQLMYL